MKSSAQRISPIIEPKVGRLYDLRSQIKTLQAQEKALTGEVSAYLENHHQETIEAGDLKAALVSCERMTVNPGRFRKQVTERDFLACVSVSPSKARTYLGEADLRKVSAITHSTRLNVSQV